jgi:hypothetical protein
MHSESFFQHADVISGLMPIAYADIVPAIRNTIFWQRGQPGMLKSIAFATLINCLTATCADAASFHNQPNSRCIGPCGSVAAISSALDAPGVSAFEAGRFVRDLHDFDRAGGTGTERGYLVQDAQLSILDPSPRLKFGIPGAEGSPVARGTESDGACLRTASRDGAANGMSGCKKAVENGGTRSADDTDRYADRASEHETYILLLAGLGLMGTIAHRRTTRFE